MTPDRRRAVVVLQNRFGVSERRACRVVGQHRSTHRYPARPIPPDDVGLRRRLRRVARHHPRLGWRKAHMWRAARAGSSIIGSSAVCGVKRACAGHRRRRIGNNAPAVLAEFVALRASQPRVRTRVRVRRDRRPARSEAVGASSTNTPEKPSPWTLTDLSPAETS